MAALALLGSYSGKAFAQVDAGTYSCTPGDIQQSLSTDLSCDTSGIVVFGSDITEFIVAQCGAVAAPGQSNSSKRDGAGACMRCARKAADVYRFAVKANLIQSSSGSLRPSEDKIKKLCKLPDQVDGQNETGSPATQSMMSQIKLCLPQEGQTVDPSTCMQCAQSVLDNALSASVITQAKYLVFKQSITKACNDREGSSGENEGGGSARPTPPAGGARPTPPAEGPRPTPPAEGVLPTPPAGATPGAVATPQFGNMDPFLNALRGCVAQYSGKVDDCLSCISAVPVDGLDPARVGKALDYAKGACAGTFQAPK